MTLIFVADADGQCVHIGGAWQAMTGQPVAEALGRGWLSRVHGEDRRVVADALARARAARAGFELHYRLLAPGGGSRWVVSVGAPSLGPRGVLGILGSVNALPDEAGVALRAYGRLGRPAASRCEAPAAEDGLAAAADRLIAACTLLEAAGATAAALAVRVALIEVGYRLADRMAAA